MRTKVKVSNRRRILCLFPAYTPSFGTFSHAYKLMPGVRAFMPPQGLLLIAAYMPAEWEVRFVDENIGPATAGDLAWADAVMVSGMHIQAPQIRDIRARVKAAGKEDDEVRVADIAIHLLDAIEAGENRVVVLDAPFSPGPATATPPTD